MLRESSFNLLQVDRNAWINLEFIWICWVFGSWTLLVSNKCFLLSISFHVNLDDPNWSIYILCFEWFVTSELILIAVAWERTLPGASGCGTQASRMRISKTEFISCPSCGRTLFNLSSTSGVSGCSWERIVDASESENGGKTWDDPIYDPLTAVGKEAFWGV